MGAAGSTTDSPCNVQQATFLWWHFSVFVLPLTISTVAVGVGPIVAIRESKADVSFFKKIPHREYNVITKPNCW